MILSVCFEVKVGPIYQISGSYGRWDQEPWFTGTMVIVTEQTMTKYRTVVSSRMGSDFNEKTN